MNQNIIIAIAAASSLIVLLAIYVIVKFTKKRKLPSRIKEQWQQIQRLCSNKETWVQAVIDADKLLDSVLKKKRFKGRSMGERLVSAQRKLKDNDAVWYAHKLAKKLSAQTRPAVRESEAKKSLIGVRQALRDIGVMDEK